MRDEGLPHDALLQLEATIGDAFATGDESQLQVLGYGEISSVVAWEAHGQRYACKRLPPFRDARDAERYRQTFDAYVTALRARGLALAESVLQTITRDDGSVVLWCAQPVLSAGTLLPAYLKRCNRAEAIAAFRQLADRVVGCVDGRLGLDGQVSNWALADARLIYFDVTTPLMRDERGREQLDVRLFMASLPWVVRGLGRFVLKPVVNKYYEQRGVLLDVVGNLYKERLTSLLPEFIHRANAYVAPPLTTDEVETYYARDARVWAGLQRLRRIDRFWQRKVRRRPYPFLLPGDISR